MSTDGNRVDRVADKVKAHMSWDVEKLCAWFDTPNPPLNNRIKNELCG